MNPLVYNLCREEPGSSLSDFPSWKELYRNITELVWDQNWIKLNNTTNVQVSNRGRTLEIFRGYGNTVGITKKGLNPQRSYYWEV